MLLTAPIISAARLATHGGDVVLCDVRWYLDGRDGHAAYLAGHLPGAVWIDLDTTLAAPASVEAGRHPLPHPTAFAAGLAAAGIDEDQPVVAYDDLGGMAAGRLVWLLRALGREAALLDGGLQAWPGALEEGEVARPPVRRTPRPWPVELLADAEDVARAASGGDAVVLDARAPERYRGEVEPIDSRAGHVPGARNAPFAGNLDGDGQFLHHRALEQRYRDLGVLDDDTEVIVYCGSGVSACHDLLALEAAGHPRPRTRLYPGSWSQWSADPSRPIATGSEP